MRYSKNPGPSESLAAQPQGDGMEYAHPHGGWTYITILTITRQSLQRADGAWTAAGFGSFVGGQANRRRCAAKLVTQMRIKAPRRNAAAQRRLIFTGTDYNTSSPDFRQPPARGGWPHCRPCQTTLLLALAFAERSPTRVREGTGHLLQK